MEKIEIIDKGKELEEFQKWFTMLTEADDNTLLNLFEFNKRDDSYMLLGSNHRYGKRFHSREAALSVARDIQEAFWQLQGKIIQETQES